MPIYTIDTEFTEKQEFVIGSITNEKLKTTVFTKRQEMQDYIKAKAIANAKRNINTYLYAHFHKADLPVYWNLDEVVINREVPLIAYHKVKIEGKKRPSKIYFLDTMALFRGSVDDLLYMLKNEKKTIKFTDDDKKELIKLRRYLNKKEFKFSKKTDKILKKWIEYNKEDSRILMEFLLLIRKKCKENNINIKRLFSSGQIAINNFLNILAKDDKKFDIFRDLNKRVFFQPKDEINVKIHKAYRGPRNQVWNIGDFKKVYYMDINSAYGQALKNVRIPVLKNVNEVFFNRYHKFDEFERKVYLTNKINKIGVCKAVMLKKKATNVGYLSIRWNKHSIFPNTPNTLLIGTWTNYEIKNAIKEGYELIHIFEYIYYPEDIENPVKPLITNWYKQRLKSPLDKLFFKGLITNVVGKLGEIRKDKEILIDDVSRLQEYTNKGFKVIGISGKYDYVYQKTYRKSYTKYYCPIIPAYVTAYARNQLYTLLKKIPAKHLLQTNTDSIMFLTNKYIKYFKVSNKLGEWKFEKQGVPAKIFAKNSYILDNEIKISGINKKESKKQLDKIKNNQPIDYTRFQSIYKNNQKEIISRDFIQSSEKEKEFEKTILKNRIFLDEKEADKKVLNWLVENNQLIEDLLNN